MDNNLERAYNVLEKIYSQRGEISQLNSFAFIYKDNEEIFMREYCYSLLLDWKSSCEIEEKEYKNILYFVDNPFHHKNQTPKDFELNYISWLVNESHWKDIYILKDIKEIYYKGMIYNTNHPARLVVFAAVALRMITEWKNNIKAWDNFNKYTDGHISLILSHYFKKEKEYLILNKCEGHSLFGYNNINKNILKNIIKGDYIFYEGEEDFMFNPSYNKSRNYISNLFGFGGSSLKLFSNNFFTTDKKEYNYFGTTKYREFKKIEKKDVEKMIEEFLKENLS